jgi:hypothetical protein
MSTVPFKQEFNVQLGVGPVNTIEFTAKCNTPKTLEEVRADFAWWREECEALVVTHPDTDDAYPLILEKRGYTVTFFEFDFTFKVHP